MSDQTPTLDRRRSTPAGFSHVVRFLDYLGVHYNKAPGWGCRGGRAGFWQRNDGELEYIFNDAKRAYAAAAKRAHPDNGGSHKAMISLNEGWALLKRQFSIRCRTLDRRPQRSIPLPRSQWPSRQKAARAAEGAAYRARHPRLRQTTNP